MEWKNMLFGSAIKKYLEMEKSKLQSTTFESYIRYADRIQKYFDGNNIKVSDINIEIIDEYYYYLRQRNITENTVKHYHIIIHKFLKYLYKRNHISVDLTILIDKPKVSNYKENFLKTDECTLILEKTKNTRIYTAVLLGLFYGLRRSEICGLQWSDIDFENNLLYINKRLVCVKINDKKNLLLENNLKSSSSFRTLPLFPEMKDYLLSIKREDYDFVVSVDNGKPIEPNKITDTFRYLVKKYNLPKIRFHDLRHSCASLLVNNNVEMKYIQNYLGHSNYNITANLYSHLYTNANKVCVETISKNLSII